MVQYFLPKSCLNVLFCLSSFPLLLTLFFPFTQLQANVFGYIPCIPVLLLVSFSPLFPPSSKKAFILSHLEASKHHTLILGALAVSLLVSPFLPSSSPPRLYIIPFLPASQSWPTCLRGPKLFLLDPHTCFRGKPSEEGSGRGYGYGDGCAVRTV